MQRHRVKLKQFSANGGSRNLIRKQTSTRVTGVDNNKLAIATRSNEPLVRLLPTILDTALSARTTLLSTPINVARYREWSRGRWMCYRSRSRSRA